ncbi:MAG: AhpC/TSA family protein [Gammaproteobacteria bacterium]|nr:AhpC/TSA family protein [Gammaproteobacteria bacterium]
MFRIVPSVLLALVAFPGPAAEKIPDLGARIAEFQARREGPGLDPRDRATLARAERELAERMPDPGLEPGQRAPDFTLPNAYGERVTLSRHLEEGPVILTFYRGAWCPYCNLELKALHDALPQFRRYGATLIAVTPQTPTRSREQLRADPYPFEVLSDLDSSVMRAYGLYFEVPEAMSDVYRRNLGLDLADYNGEGRYVLPVPGTFVIDRQGVVRAAFADTDYTRRMEPKAILAALRRIAGGRIE